MGEGAWIVAALVATGLHAGFQLAVSLVVYPALASTPDAEWARRHEAHARRITPLVAFVYAAALVSTAGAAWADRSAGTLVALAGTGAAVLLTAAWAAPLHGRLGAGRDDVVLRRLILADRLRTLASLVAVTGAAVAAVAAVAS